jgi:inorganic pyrophosphatase
MLDTTTVDALAIGPGIIGLLFAVVEWTRIARVKVTGEGPTAPLFSSPEEGKKAMEVMTEVSQYIAEGANAFLIEEYKYMVVYMVIFSVILGPFVGQGTTIAFNVGAVTSCLSGWIGMKVAVASNYRTAYESWASLPRGFALAVRGGSVMGLVLVSLGTMICYGLIKLFKTDRFYGDDSKALYEALAGYGLGGSSIALFGRVGGGIYTKAADVGADLSGKNEWGLDEDDPRNPACIADNVGDNVGDVAGMGADLFGSFAEATCAAMVIAGSSGSVLVNGKENKMAIDQDFGAMCFPLLLSCVGIITGILTLLICRVVYKINEDPDSSIERGLKGILIISTILQSFATYAVAFFVLPAEFQIDEVHVVTPMTCCYCILAGLWSGLVIGVVTEYYTSHTYRPTREISESQEVSAATGIIFGLALGYKSCIVPTFCLAFTICLSHICAGMYGIALAALGMLGTLVCALTIDVYGPISDNAGGIAEMAGLDEYVRERTDALDAAGNTTAAVGKGFAIGSAALVSLALFGAYTVRADVAVVDVLNPWTFTGLLYGAMMPYWFSAMTMKSVGIAANDMVRECNRQFPMIMQGAAPEYDHCVAISTKASLREMIAPGALVILSPLLFGVVLGKNATAGLLCGALVSGVQLAISMSNSGGAWDNAKKYIEAGGLGEGKGKKTPPHANAVIGDTVGDPLKDTSGPALNIVMKLCAIMSLVFGSVISGYSNPEGGPLWLKSA